MTMWFLWGTGWVEWGEGGKGHARWCYADEICKAWRCKKRFRKDSNICICMFFCLNHKKELKGSLAQLAAKANRRKRWRETKKGTKKQFAKSIFEIHICNKTAPIIEWSINSFLSQRGTKSPYLFSKQDNKIMTPPQFWAHGWKIHGMKSTETH